MAMKIETVSAFAHDTLVVDVAVEGDWRDWTFAAECRASRSLTADLLVAFEVDDSALTVDGGTVRFTISAEAMEALTTSRLYADFRAINPLADPPFEVTLAAVDFTTTPNVTELP